MAVGDVQAESFHIERDPLCTLCTGGVIVLRDTLENKEIPECMFYLSPVRSVVVRVVAAGCFIALSIAAIVEAAVRLALGLISFIFGMIPLGDTYQSDMHRFSDNSFIAAKHALTLSVLSNLMAIYFNVTEKRIEEVINRPDSNPLD
jgi:hypothetical protein